MAVLIWGFASTAFAFIIHLVVWRIRLPKYQTKALLAIFFGVLGALVACLAAGLLAGLPLPMPGGVPDYFHILALGTAMALAYIATYSAMEADSPTLVIVKAIRTAGPGGLGEGDFRAQVSDDVLVKPRVADLVRDRMLVAEGDHFRITGKGRRFVSIFIRARQVLGAGKGG